MDISILLAFLMVVIVGFLILFPTNDEKARSKKMLMKIPGLTNYPLAGTVLKMILMKKEDRMTWVTKVALANKRFLLRWNFLTVNVISVCSPDLLEVVLRNTNLIDKGVVYKLFNSWLGNGLLTSTGSKWHHQRKIITPTFHFSILDGFVVIFAEKAKILVEKLKKEIGGPGFNIRQYVSKCALDIICETAMGISCDAQERDSPYVTAVNRMTDIVSTRLCNPFLFPDFLFKLSPTYRKQESSLKTIQGFVNKVIQERRNIRQSTNGTGKIDDSDDIGRKRRAAFLDTLLAANEDGNKMTDEEIRDEVNTFMFEGHDTVTAGMCWALFELGHHPEIQEKAYEELEEIFQGSDRVPTISDLNNMNYLERVIKEVLRLHPTGTNLEIPIHHIHMDPEVYPNPEDFNPDHFLPEKVVNRHPYAYIPFSAGPRNCIGQRFAMLEEKTVLSYLIRNFKFETLNKREGFKIYLEIINTPTKPIKLAIKPRKL
ncbi:Cytochrome P450 4c21 [Blattella germanica]|nr:Cytochrome P450 4c21 [Blattella germanica]